MGKRTKGEDKRTCGKVAKVKIKIMVFQVLEGFNNKVSKDQFEVVRVSVKEIHCSVPILFFTPQ